MLYNSYLVRVPITSIDATMLVVKLNSTGDGLSECEPAGLGDGPTELVPNGLGHIFGHKGVL